MPTGIVLAGGMSSRMNQNKMLLHFKRKAIIQHTIDHLSSVCDKIVIVTGHYKEDYKALFNYNNSIYQINNEDYQEGMFSSVLAGVRSIDPDDLFIIPGDYPLVKEQTYKELLNQEGVIRVPTYQHKKGHPIFISKQLFTELQNEPISSNLKVFRDRHDVSYIDVNDPHILFDIDDMMEYQKLLDMERMD